MKKAFLYYLGILLIFIFLAGCSLFDTTPDTQPTGTLPTFQTFDTTTPSSSNTSSNSISISSQILYTLSFNSMGGSPVNNMTLAANATVGSTTIATDKPGSQFCGWFSEQELINQIVFPFSMPAQDTMLFACWIPLNSIDLVFSWGFNEMGQLGRGGTYFALGYIPRSIDQYYGLDTDETITMIALGDNHSISLSSNHRVFSSGWNHNAQLGVPNSMYNVRRTPLDITNYFPLQAYEYIEYIASGDNHSFALSNLDFLYCWGNNDFEQLTAQVSSNIVSSPEVIDTNTFLQSQEQIRFIEAGESHTLILTNQNRIYSFGNNQDGQLGVGNAILSTGDPRDMTVVFEPVLSTNDILVQIAAGESHSLALSEKGDIFAWGKNDRGQLGDSTTDNSYHPIKVELPGTLDQSERVIQIAAGGDSSFALTDAGTLLVWGKNETGQLGINSYYDHYLPIEANGFFDMDESDYVTKIVAGKEHAVFLTDNYQVYTAGYQEFAQLGDNYSAHSRTTFQNITDQFNLNTDELVTSIFAGGRHNYALSTTGYTITFDTHGGSQVSSIIELAGNPIQQPNPNPQRTGYSFNGWFTSSTCSTPYIFSTMPNQDITVHACWIQTSTVTIDFDSQGGSAVDSISAIPGTSISKPSPDPVLYGHEFDGWFTDDTCQVAYQFTTMPTQDITLYACWTNITSSGGLFAWGDNWDGDLGNGTMGGYPVLLPSEMTMFVFNSGETIIDVVAGQDHGIALTSEYRVFTWGRNDYGQLGNGLTVDSFIPIDITSQFNLPSTDHVELIFTGHSQNFAVTSEGEIYAWGDNIFGQLGDGTTTNQLTPVLITSQFSLSVGESIIQIQGGVWHSVALTNLGRVFTWGSGGHGQIGNGTFSSTQLTPLDITANFNLDPGDQIIKIESGFLHVIALSNNHEVFGWGNSQYGQVGIGTITNRNTPTSTTSQFELPFGSQVIDIVAGFYHNHAILENGDVVSWGRNDYGNLGLNNMQPFYSTPMSMLSQFNLNPNESIIKIFSNGDHSFAITSENRVFSWGSNFSGELGDGTIINRIKPVEITANFNLPSNKVITKILPGFTHNYALMETNTNP